MDPRKWFFLEDRPPSREWEEAVQYIPDSDDRCPAVMKVYLAGRRLGFRLTDAEGRPTETLRLMVDVMGAELCPLSGLSAAERRRFTDHKGVADRDFRERWFIRDITTRLRIERGKARTTHSWPWYMFKTERNLGLMCRYGSETVAGVRTWGWFFLAVVPPDWYVTRHIYNGLREWTRGGVGRSWDSYEYLDWLRSMGWYQSKGGSWSGGHAEVVSVAGQAGQ